MAVQDGEKVILNVYDLSQGLARQLSASFLGKTIEGIWHTGVVVYGREYYFGGGIQSTVEGMTPYGKPLKVVELGYTHIPKEMLEEYLQEISPRYTAETYSLLTHNCNTFSDEVAQFLVGNGIPDYIRDLPQEVMNSPMGSLFMPMIQQFEGSLRHGGVPQVPMNRQQPPSLNFSQIHIPSPPPSNTTTTNTTNNVVPTLNAQRAEKAPVVGSSGKADSIGGGAKSLEEGKSHTTATSTTSSDPLGQARARVQEEITLEFAKLMAEGTLRASEAAAIATRRVMARHGVAART